MKQSAALSRAETAGTATAGTASRSTGARLLVVTLPLALGAGFWLGYATLARRLRNKCGGIKVY